MLLFEMFDIIAQSGVGNLGNSFLIIFQLYISLFFEIKFLFSSMKNKPLFLIVSISMIPMVAIATYSIGCGIIFSAFLGDGPNIHEMTKLVNLTLSQTFIYEMMLFVITFFALTMIYSMVYKLKPMQWIVTFGIEVLASISLLVLYGGLLIDDFPFTILDLCNKDIYLSRWIIYGYFVIIFKCFILMISLFLGLLLREKKFKNDNEEEKYFNSSTYNQKKVLKFLTKGDLLGGISLLMFGVFSVAILIFGVSNDKTFTVNVETVFLIVLMLALFSIMPVLGITLIYRAARPKRIKAYRQLLEMGHEDTILRMFCEEIIDDNPTERRLRFNNSEIKTSHFLLTRQGIKVSVKWIGNPSE